MLGYTGPPGREKYAAGRKDRAEGVKHRAAVGGKRGRCSDSLQSMGKLL